MEFVFRRHTSLLLISVVSACLDNEKTVGYENGAVDLAFSANVAGSGLKTYQITRTNGDPDKALLSVIYQDGNVVYTDSNGGVESIGNVSVGNLSIRIPSMNISFADNYSLKRSGKEQAIKCIELVFRVRRRPPVISNSDPSGNSITGIEHKNVTLVCRSTGGYPKPTMAWYRTSNQTSPLITNKDDPQSDNKTYQLDYTFRAVRADDGATFVCQSSYDPPDPLYMHAEIRLYLSLKPSTPVLTLRSPIVENRIEMEIAECTSDGFKPEPLHISWVTDGTTTPVSSYDTDYSNDTGTFHVRAVLNSTISREQNGHALKCVVNHQALDTPLESIEHYYNIQYAPDVTVTTTNVTINDSLAVLKCIPSGEPATYVYSGWQHIWPGYGRVDHPTRLGNDPILFLSALTYEYSGMYICTVNNGVSGSLRPNAGYGTVYLQVDTFPVITTPTPVKVYSNIGGTTIAYVEFYSNLPDNKLDCLRNSKHLDCHSEMQNGVIKLPVFGTIVTTMGSVARIYFDIHNTSQYGFYKVKLGNAIGTSTIDVEIVNAEMSPENQSNTGAIVGGTIAASVLVMIGIVFLVIRLKYLRQRTPKPSGTSPVIKPIDREESSLQDDASGIHLDLDEHKDVHYNFERNVYDDLQETHRETHEYGILDTEQENDTNVIKDKEYENLELHCQTSSQCS